MHYFARAQVDGVVGVKQSASDVKLLADLILGLKDRGTIFTAVDALLYPSYALGAHGSIAAILTAVPELCVKQWGARAGKNTNATITVRIPGKRLRDWKTAWKMLREVRNC